MKKITLFSLAIVCLVFSYCRKDSPAKQDNRHDITLEEARSFFNKELAHAIKLTQRHQLIEVPDWQHFSVRQAGDKAVLIVPLLFKKDLTIKANGDSSSLSVQSLTNLFFYKDTHNRIVSEVVTTIPDDALLNNKDAHKQFTGMVWIEAWDGRSIGGYNYASDGNVTSFDLGPEVAHDSLLKEQDNETQWCYIDFYYCVDASGYVTCRYNFSQAYRCGLGSGQFDGLGSEYYPVYGSGSNTGGTTTPPGDATVGIGMNTTILAPPEKPITDPYQYKRCFNRDSRNTYRIVLYVDQPKAGTRALMSDGEGNTDLWAIKGSTKTYGHTWITFEEKRPNGAIVRRSLGFWPNKELELSTQAAPGILGDDSGRDFDVSLEIGLTNGAFFDLLDDCSLGNFERYNLNTNNCTGWAIDKLYNNTSISLPRTLASWGGGLGEGPTPGNLGEDLRRLDLGKILINPVVTNVNRTTSTDVSLKNYGNCPIASEP